MTDTIHFILTGGTIDKIYDPISQTNVMSEGSTIPAYINELIKPAINITFETACMIDSRDMTNNIRADILKRVSSAPHNKLVILHGTDTMSVTAEYLNEQLGADHNKTIILTGSLIPMKSFTVSDSGFNVGFATACAQTLPPGVYVTMHGKIFRAGEVEKNVKTATFEETS